MKNNILQFPVKRGRVSPLAQINILEHRLGELEVEIALCLKDKAFVNQCLRENEAEMKDIVKELTILRRINV